MILDWERIKPASFRKFRTEHNITLQEMADRLHVSKSSLSAMERAQVRMDDDLFYAGMKILSIDFARTGSSEVLRKEFDTFYHEYYLDEISDEVRCSIRKRAQDPELTYSDCWVWQQMFVLSDNLLQLNDLPARAEVQKVTDLSLHAACLFEPKYQAVIYDFCAMLLNAIRFDQAVELGAKAEATVNEMDREVWDMVLYHRVFRLTEAGIVFETLNLIHRLESEFYAGNNFRRLMNLKYLRTRLYIFEQDHVIAARELEALERDTIRIGYDELLPLIYDLQVWNLLLQKRYEEALPVIEKKEGLAQDRRLRCSVFKGLCLYESGQQELALQTVRAQIAETKSCAEKNILVMFRALINRNFAQWEIQSGKQLRRALKTGKMALASMVLRLQIQILVKQGEYQQAFVKCQHLDQLMRKTENDPRLRY